MSKIPRCPICRKPVVKEHAPFCSARCRAIDLGRWFGEDYKLTTEESPLEDGE